MHNSTPSFDLYMEGALQLSSNDYDFDKKGEQLMQNPFAFTLRGHVSLELAVCIVLSQSVCLSLSAATHRHAILF